MKKKILIAYLSMIPLFIMAFVITYAAFTFQSEVTCTAHVGKVTLESKNYLTYNKTDKTAADFATDAAYLEYLKERKETPTVTSTSSSITCYASERIGGNRSFDAGQYGYPYLNQFGVKFSVMCEIESYVRINFATSWISQKLYKGSNIERTSIIGGVSFDDENSPFYINDTNWIYIDNYAYLKSPVKGEDLGTEKEFTFNVASDYFYQKVDNPAYYENILVEVRFYVDIVQANRVDSVWPQAAPQLSL